MGTNMPANRGLALDWINARLDPWEENAAAIGLELTDPAALVALAGAADEARVAADAARSASKAATQNWYDKADQAMDFARDLILKIKTKAAVDDDPQVYVLAQVSPTGRKSAPRNVARSRSIAWVTSSAVAAPSSRSASVRQARAARRRSWP